MRGAERVHAEDVAQRCVLLRQHLVVLALARIHPAVLQQHDIARRELEAAIHPVADQGHRPTQMLGQPFRNRRQRIRLAPLALDWPPEVRGHHHRRALLKRQP
jgi:hypothetical protein